MRTALICAALAAIAGRAKGQSADDRFLGRLAEGAAALKPAPRPAAPNLLQQADEAWKELERRSEFAYKAEAAAACEKAKKRHEAEYDELKCEAYDTAPHEAEYVLYGRGKKGVDGVVLIEQTAGFNHPAEAEAACEKAKKKYEAEYDELKCEAYYFESHAAEYKLTGRKRRR